MVADTVELSGIMRNATLEARTTMLRRLEETVKGTAAMMGGTADVRYRIGYASVYNNEELAAFASRLFARRQAELFAGIGDGAMAAGDFLRTGSQLTLDAEDFGFYSEKAPSLMVWIGTGGKALAAPAGFPGGGALYQALHKGHGAACGRVSGGRVGKREHFRVTGKSRGRLYGHRDFVREGMILVIFQPEAVRGELVKVCHGGIHIQGGAWIGLLL